MIRSNLEKYYISLKPIMHLFEQELISKNGYQKAEVYLAKKYCIKKGNLYRLNHLTIPSKRVIYRMPVEEVNNEGKNSNQIRSVTQVSEKS